MKESEEIEKNIRLIETVFLGMIERTKMTVDNFQDIKEVKEEFKNFIDLFKNFYICVHRGTAKLQEDMMKVFESCEK